VGGTCKNKPGGGVSDSEKGSLLSLAMFATASIAQDEKTSIGAKKAIDNWECRTLIVVVNLLPLIASCHAYMGCVHRDNTGELLHRV
jgi:hypothetical protein